MNIPIRFDDDGAEEGELRPIDDYDPAFEFPKGNEVSQYPIQPRTSSPSPPPASASNRTTVFRLLRLQSSILSKRVAVLDGHAEVSIGRDVVPTARVRLKEMAVSKFHASIYWDGLRREWGIVDMGSVHGTFVRSAQHQSTSIADTTAIRLSGARKSSMPRLLRHLDEITIGSTTFLVHEHLSGRPCEDCAIDGAEEIPLFTSGTSLPSRNEHSLKRKRHTPLDDANPKKAMAKLKSSLMSRHNSAPSSPSPLNAAYKDRSALRRELHPEPRFQSLPASSQIDKERTSTPPFRLPSPPPLLPAALPSTNIGHKLLLLQGWNPGTALGENPDAGLIEPINVSANASRAGLGSSQPRPAAQPPGDWREEAKRRRWDGV